MEKVGILIVSYGSREAAIAESFPAAEHTRQKFTSLTSKKTHSTLKEQENTLFIPNLDINDICKFAKKQDKIDFGIVGPEKPIIEGIRDLD